MKFSLRAPMGSCAIFLHFLLKSVQPKSSYFFICIEFDVSITVDQRYKYKNKNKFSAERSSIKNVRISCMIQTSSEFVVRTSHLFLFMRGSYHKIQEIPFMIPA